MSLVARHFEAAGLPTVIAGNAKDIVEYCGVPRMAFTDFPLGNPCGRPGDVEMQKTIVQFALNLLVSAEDPRTTEQTPFIWADDDYWRLAYGRVGDDNREELRRMGDLRRQKRTALRQQPMTS